FLEVVTNTGAAPTTFSVSLHSNLGSDGQESTASGFIATSSGDKTFTAADDWIVTDDQPGGDPTLLHVIGNPGAAQRPPSVSFPAGDLFYAWTLSLQPGETKIIMHFASQNPDQATALAKAPLLDLLPPGALAGMTALERAQVVNFNVGDGA